jgi:hypothetical protein
VFTCILASSRITRSGSWKTDPSFLRGFYHNVLGGSGPGGLSACVLHSSSLGARDRNDSVGLGARKADGDVWDKGGGLLARPDGANDLGTGDGVRPGECGLNARSRPHDHPSPPPAWRPQHLRVRTHNMGSGTDCLGGGRPSAGAITHDRGLADLLFTRMPKEHVVSSATSGLVGAGYDISSG